MCRWPRRTWRHHTCSASTQASLVSCDPNRSISAPVAPIRMPKGTTFSFAGGSWSHPLVTLPAASVRVFPPTGVVAQIHLRLRIHGDLQGRAVALHLFPYRVDVGEDRVGLLGLLLGLAFVDLFGVHFLSFVVDVDG